MYVCTEHTSVHLFSQQDTKLSLDLYFCSFACLFNFCVSIHFLLFFSVDHAHVGNKFIAVVNIVKCFVCTKEKQKPNEK